MLRKNASHTEYTCWAFPQYELPGGYSNEIYEENTSHTQNIGRAFHLDELSDAD